MGEVVSLEIQEETGSGEAICTRCRHTWVATAPAGTDQLECPSCVTMHGLFKHPYHANEDELCFQCQCGGELFYITKAAIRCRNCGAAQRPYDQS